MACNFAGYGRFSTSKMLLMLMTLMSFDRISGTDHWYQGCYELSESSDQGTALETSAAEIHPVLCGRACGSSVYVAVRADADCRCLENLPANSLPKERCLSRCAEQTPGGLALPCGDTADDQTWSMYMVAGPYIQDLTILPPPSPVHLGHPTAVQVTVRLAGDPHRPLGLPGLSDVNPAVLTIGGEGADQSHSEYVTAAHQTVTTVWQPELNREANYVLTVTAVNALSSKSARINITVVYPVPTDLSLTLASNALDTPVCIPEDIRQRSDTRPTSTSTHPAFHGTQLRFEALLSAGLNLTFDWTIRKLLDFVSGDEVDEIQHNSTFVCQGACRSRILVYEFPAVGEYQVSVVVHHRGAPLTAHLYMLILESEISNLQLERISDVSAPAISPGQVTTYRVTMETTTRHQAVLQVQFGDGGKVLCPLDEINNYPSRPGNASIGAPGDKVTITNDYGNTCTLSIDVEHTYDSEGHYLASVRVHNPHSNLSTESGVPLIVQRPLEGAWLPPRTVTAVGIPVHLELTLQHWSTNYTVTWSVQAIGGGPGQEFLDHGSVLTHEFGSPSQYLVTARADNLLGTVTAEGVVIVEVAVSGLLLEHSGLGNYLNITQDITFSASVTAGTNVVFQWEFYDGDTDNLQVISGENTSTVLYSFKRVGEYNVTVRAYNEYNRREYTTDPLRVQQPVGILLVQSADAVRKGHSIEYTASVSAGSDVQFEFDFGSGRVPANTGSVKNQATKSHTHDHVGKVNFTVYAFNIVSMVTREWTTEVQDMVPNLELSRVFAPVQREQVVFTALTNGVPLQRSDVWFSWILDGSHVQMTAAPLLNLSFEALGQYNMSVSASNLVSQKSAWLLFTVSEPPSEEARFTQAPIIIKGQLKTFRLVSLPAGPLEFVITYQLGSKNEQKTLNTSAGYSYSWQDSFMVTGLYSLDVDCRPEGRPHLAIESYMIVEEPITDLQLGGPRAVPLAGSRIKYHWTASSRGSHIVYMWGEGSNYTSVSTCRKHYWEFHQEGRYNLAVMANNALGSMAAYANVTVQRPIMALVLSSTTTIAGRALDITIGVSGGLYFTFDIDFGDGSPSVPVSSRDNTSLQTTDARSLGTEFGYRIQHTYREAGHLMLRVNASNLVSHMYRSILVNVEEQISGLRVTSPSGPTVAVGEKVFMTASVATGNDLSFTFFFGEIPEKPFHSDNKSYTASHVYTQPGNHKLRVSVTNPYQQVPISAELDYSLQVVTPMSGLRLERTIDTSDCVALQNFTTRTIGFNASLERGSDVTFELNFGDGTPKVSKVAESLYAHFTHTYSAAGEYEVAVTARSVLGVESVLLPRRVCVQVAPEGVLLNSANHFYKTLLGTATDFRVTFKAGTLLEFDWTLGDGTVSQREASELSHVYERAGQYSMLVVARNRVGQETATAVVSVQAVLREVELEAEPLVQEVGKLVHLRAVPHPNHPHGVLHYHWHLPSVIPPTQEPTISHRFRNYGRFPVTVTAENYQSNQTSDPVVIHIIDPISKLDIQVDGEGIIGSPILFHVHSFRGSEVTYTFNLEHNVTITTYEIPTVNHTFMSGGEYEVTVNASNLLSSQSASTTIFITKTYCNIPKVQMLGDVYQFPRSMEIHVETEVKIDCSLTERTLYQWEVFQDAEYKQRLTLAGIQDRVFHDSFLFLPPLTLNYGVYYLLLKVSMEGVIVKTNQTRRIEVVPSPLMSVIRGGIQRLANRNETLVLNGSLSYDPDYPEATDLRYNWTCYELAPSQSSCFQESSRDLLTSVEDAVIHVPGHAFKPLGLSFVFNLTVWRPKRDPSTVSQVVRMEGTAVIDANILCVQCQMGFINMDERLVLETIHSGVPENQLVYSWSFEVVLDGSDNLIARVHDKGKCVQADNSTYQSFRLPDSTTTTGPTSTTPSTTSSEPTTTTPSTTTTTVTMTTVAATTPAIRAGLPISEGSSDRRGRGRGSGRGGFSPGRMFEEGGSDPRSFVPQSTGSPSIGGFPITGEGRDDREPTDRGGREDPGRGAPSPSQPSDDDQPSMNPATDELQPRRSFVSVVSLEREDLRVVPGDTTTGLKGRVLVLREGVLEQGRTYMVGVTVRHKDSGVEGNALTYFRVNQSPVKGECKMTLDNGGSEGVEMETNYGIFCSGWKDSEHPISYRISYSLRDSDTPDLVYQGLNHDVSFQLPAGDPSNNYQVKIHISILDGLGARTSVCSIPTRVLPKHFDVSNRTEEEILYDLVEEDGSTLQTFIQRGDNRNARLHAHMVASRLNRLLPPTSQGSEQWRKKTRRAMLWALKDLPIRNQYEIQQMTSTVAVTTAVTQELSDESMNYTTGILQKASNQMLSMASVTQSTSSSNALNVLKGASNLLEAITTETVANLTAPTAREIVQRSHSVVQTLMKASVNHLVTGEAAVEQHTDLIHTVAGRYRTSTLPKLTTPDAAFVLPGGLQTVLDAALEKDQAPEDAPEQGYTQEDCYQAHMVTYQQNPYSYSTPPDMIQTQVASLTLFSCKGQEIVVENLTKENGIDIVLPHRAQQELGAAFVLNKKQMNIHDFDLTEENMDQSLHIDISLVPTDRGRLFPIAVLLGEDIIPGPDQYLRRWEYGTDTENITITVEPSLLQEDITYYIGVVDASFNEGRPRPGDLKQRSYHLKLWWGQCLYWSSESDSWSPEGCAIKTSSSYFEAHCSCQHLSSFGAHLSLAPNNLDFTNVDDFFSLEENPVTFCLVATLIVVYAMLLVVCVRLDRLDEHKSPILPLADNHHSHRQVYIVTLETGFRGGAGTTAKVSLVLHGQEGMSETRELVSDGEHRLFDRNSRDTFILTLPESLGHIFKIQIWHNNAGASPSWFLSRATVRDAVSGNVYYFVCEKWFAVEEEDEKVEREIMVTEQGLGFRKMVWAKSTQLFADYHLWFSTFSRPSYSRFTRAQRLTCCLSLLMSYMAVSAAWYRPTQPQYRGEFGLIDISWRSLVVGVVTSLIVLPPNYILVMIFRRSKFVQVRKSRSVSCRNCADEYKSAAKRQSFSSIASAAHLLQPVMRQSILDQTLSSWQSLQHWAQRTWAKRHGELTPSDSTHDTKPLHGSHHDNHHPHTGSKVTGQGERPAGESNLHKTVDSAAPMEMDTMSNLQCNTKSQCIRPEEEIIHDHGTVSETITDKQEVEPDSQSPSTTSQPDSTSGSSCQGSPRSRHSTAISDLSSTPSSGKTAARIPRSTPRSQWSVTRSDLSSMPPINVRTRRSKCVFLPGGCVYVAWILSFCIIAGCATVTILYGFRFGQVKSIQWLQSLFFSAVQCIFVTHPVIIIMTSVVLAFSYRKDLSIFDTLTDDVIQDNVKGEMAKIKAKAKDDDPNFDEGLANRQRSRYLRFARPPQEKQLLEARNKTIKEKKATAMLSQTSQVIVQFVLLLIMALCKDQRPMFALNNTISQVLARTGAPAFDDIKTVGQWWNWSQSHFIDCMYWTEWYNGDATDFENNYIQTSVLIGQVNLRQLRVKDQDCQLPPPYMHVTPSCRNAYSDAAKSRTAFGHNTTWWHMRQELTGAHSLSGKHATYDGDGFLVLLPSDRESALAELQFLEIGEWIDRQTRAIIIEFTLFHPQTSLFTSVKLLSEFPPTGGVMTTHLVSSVYLYKYQTILDNILLACELLFVIVTFIRLHHITVNLLNSKQRYLHHPWHWCQIIQGLLSLAFVICFMYRFILVWDTIQRLHASYHEVYVDVSQVQEWDHVLRSLIGFLSCLTLLQLLKALHHRKPFAVFENIFHHAAIDIATCGAVFLIWVCAYTSLGSALYASLSEYYSSAGGALLATTGLFTGIYEPLTETLVNDAWGLRALRLFTASFMVFGLGFLSAYVLAVLSFHYKVYKHEAVLMLSTQQSLLYYWNRLLIFFGLKQASIPQDDQPILPLEFTMAELEYQVDEMLFKLNALTETTNLPEKPPVYFTDSDATYGQGEDGLSSGGSDVRGYEDEHLGRKVNKLEENLLQHEPHLAQLIRLDQMGTKVLAQEHEKQIRSQLEMMIFRQLQQQRPEYPAVHRQLSNNSASTGYQASLSQSSNESGRGLLGGDSNVQLQTTHAPKTSASTNRSTQQGTAPDPHPHDTREKSSGNPTKSDPGDPHNSTVHPIKLPNKLSFPKTPQQLSAPVPDKPTSTHQQSRQHQTLQDLDKLAIVEALAKHGINESTGNIVIPLADLKVTAPTRHSRSSSDNTVSSGVDERSADSSSSGGAEVLNVLQGTLPSKTHSKLAPVPAGLAQRSRRARSAEKYRKQQGKSDSTSLVRHTSTTDLTQDSDFAFDNGGYESGNELEKSRSNQKR